MSAVDIEYVTARSLGRHGLLGSVAMIALVGGLGFWAAITPLSGAVVAGGGSNNVPVYADGTNWRIG